MMELVLLLLQQVHCSAAWGVERCWESGCASSSSTVLQWHPGHHVWALLCV